MSYVQENHPGIEIIQNELNLGYAAGYNVGLRHAYERGADYFFILNNDPVVPPQTLATLVRVAEADPTIGFVSGKVFFHDRPVTLQTAGKRDRLLSATVINVGQNEVDVGQHDEQHDYDFLDDVFWLVRRDVYAKVGGYDPDFFLYWEETDWCARARREGFKLVYTPEAKVLHKGRSPLLGGSPGTSMRETASRPS